MKREDIKPTDFLESCISQIIAGHYLSLGNRFPSSLQIDLEEWLTSQPGSRRAAPLFILEDPLVPTKTLIADWIQLHKSKETKREKDIIIQYFVSAGRPNNVPANMVFSLMCELRQKLQLSKQLEVEPEQIRKNFPGFLGGCSQILQRQQLFNIPNINEVVLLIEGVDRLQFQHFGDIFLWFPKKMPPKISLAMTVSPSGLKRIRSDSIDMLTLEVKHSHSLQKVNAYLEKLESLRKLGNYAAFSSRLKRVLATSGSVFVAGLGYELLFPNLDPHQQDSFMPFTTGIDIDSLQHLSSVQALYTAYVEAVSRKPEFEITLQALCKTSKGLTAEQLSSLSKSASQQIDLLVKALGPLVLHYQSRLSIKSSKFRKAVSRVCKAAGVSHLIREVLASKCREDLRRLPQLVFHVEQCHNYSLLKELITPLQNFVVLNRAEFKCELYAMWAQVIAKVCVDPVDEFNKSLEIFRSEYTIGCRDLFRFIAQISQFLKRFVDFETRDTLSFMHPKIVGKEEHLIEMKVLAQLLVRDMFSEKESRRGPVPTLPFSALIENRVRELATGKRRPPESIAQAGQDSEERKSRKVYDIKQLVEMAFPAFKRVSIDSKPGKDKFRLGYLQEAKSFLVRVGVLKKGYEGADTYQFPADFRLGDEADLYYQLFSPRVNYNYRRWLWIQIPWLSIEVSADFSHSMGDRDGRLSIEEERKQYLRTLEIALAVKEEKDKILLKNRTSAQLQSRPREGSALQTMQSRLPSIDSKSFKKEGKAKLRRVKHPRGKADHSKERPRESFLTQLPPIASRSHEQLNVRNSYYVSRAFREQFAEEKVIGKMEKQMYSIRKELDLTTFANRRIEHELTETSKLNIEELQDKELQTRRRIVAKIEESRGRLRAHWRSIAVSELTFARFQKIILICKLNETCNKEWTEYLNKFNSSLKRMIRLEEASLKAFKNTLRQTKIQLYYSPPIKSIYESAVERTNLPAAVAPSQPQLPAIYFAESPAKSQDNELRKRAHRRKTHKGKEQEEEKEKEGLDQIVHQLQSVFKVKLRNILNSDDFCSLKKTLQTKAEYQLKSQEGRDALAELSEDISSKRKAIELQVTFLQKMDEEKTARQEGQGQTPKHSLGKEQLNELKTQAHNRLLYFRQRGKGEDLRSSLGLTSKRLI